MKLDRLLNLFVDGSTKETLQSDGTSLFESLDADRNVVESTIGREYWVDVVHRPERAPQKLIFESAIVDFPPVNLP